MLKSTIAIGLFGVVGLLGCANAPEPEGQDYGAAAPAQSTQGARGLVEYRHTANRSRMVTGPNAVARFEDGMQKVVGDWGTIAVDRNGHSQGVPNAGVAMLDVAPYGSTLEEHNEHVKAMFLSAGLPANEIGTVQGSVGQGYGGRAGEQAERYGHSFYVSTVTRMAEGIPVGESFAWARINERDEVVSEAVYWPAIPQKVVEEAKALQAKLAEPGGREAFLSGILIRDEGELVSSRVIIRHSSAVTEGPFEAHAVYDVTRRTSGGASHTHHFDANGAELLLPQERRMVSTPRALPAQ